MPTSSPEQIIERARAGIIPEDSDALRLADAAINPHLLAGAAAIRDQGFGNIVTYSRKVFIPLTRLCRDVCHYCTFAATPKHIDAPFMSSDDVLAIVRAGHKLGCKEVLFTLGEKPELRYPAARRALAELGCTSTLEYTAAVARRVLSETGLLPHINAGNMNAQEIAMLRPVSASMGIMLESAASRLCAPGMPHYGSPDKNPLMRLETMRLAGEARVPFTSGILIGIGETRRERIESLLALRHLHRQHGHLQEVIIQNFRAKPGTKMAFAPEPDLDDLLWTLAVARIVFGAEMSIQVPPNLSPGVLERLVEAGINDWGGVSPLTPDHVNPEAPWPHLDELARATSVAGKHLEERLTLYPAYAQQPDIWLDTALHTPVIRLRDGEGFARADHWVAGTDSPPPENLRRAITHRVHGNRPAPDFLALVDKARSGSRLDSGEIVRLFKARGDEFSLVCQTADGLRQQTCGDTVTYVVNRNINYTNICYFKCQFCAFSKGKTHADLRGKPYDLDNADIRHRILEARARGATEVCMQGGIHPDYDGHKYLDLLQLVKDTASDIHIHAFSPLEVWQGARTLGVSIEAFLRQLKAAGLNTLPGTAAEILDDGVRSVLCPDKISAGQWLEVIRTAHRVGFKTTATIMFGHVDDYASWAHHLLQIRDLQAETGGFTEFVPLPFVAPEAPIYRRGKARNGPTFRESVLMHAIARLVLHPLITNIQTSWVKMGPGGVAACLQAGANDLGGTLMNESITRAAGATHGEEFSPLRMQHLIGALGRTPQQRTTLYQPIPPTSAASTRQPGSDGNSNIIFQTEEII